MERKVALLVVDNEIQEATGKFGPMASPHEGIAVIREEYIELEKEVFKQFTARDTGKMRKEAKHLAAMAIRFMMDLT